MNTQSRTGFSELRTWINRSMVAGVGAALTALVLLSACSDGPTGVIPDAPTTPAYEEHSVNEFGQHNGTVTVPMKVEASMMWVVSGATPADCPDLIDPSSGELFTAEGSGEGEATHLGRFEITELDHPTINLCSTLEDPPVPPAPGDLRRDGTFEFVAADGSSLSGTYSFLLAPENAGGFFTLFVEDGTRRLEGATGELEVDFEESGRSQPSDPLSLGKTTLDPAVFKGSLTLQRP